MRNSNPYDGRNTPRDPGARVTQNLHNEADPDEIKEDIGRTRAKMDRTLDELTDKLRPRRWIEDAIDAIRSSSAADSIGEAAMTRARNVCRDGAELARRHPIPAALLVGGLAWLAIEQITGRPIIARRRAPHWEQEDPHSLGAAVAPTTEGMPARSRGSVTGRPVYGGTYSAGAGQPAGRPSDYGESASRSERLGHSMRGMGSMATERVSHALHRTADAARNATHRARDAASNAADRLSDVVHHTADRARNAGERVRHATHDMSQRASHLANDAAHRVSTGARIAQERGRETVESHPLAVAGATFGLGLLAGVALPPSRREDQWFGEESDEMKGAARRMGEEALERGKEVAAAVRDEAERQGLTPHELMHRGERVLETAEHEAKRAVKDELSGMRSEGNRGAESASGARRHEQGSMFENKPGEHYEPGHESST